MNEQEIYRAMVKAYEKYPQNNCEIYDKAIDDDEMKELLEKLSEED